MSRVTLQQVRAALDLPDFDDDAARDVLRARPRRIRPPRDWREGAVLVLLYPGEGGGLEVVLTRRSDTVEHHRGQISFPGGAREDGESLLRTALRETEEEIGVARDSVTMLGDLPLFRIPPSGFVIRPFVGTLSGRPAFRPDSREVAEIVGVPLDLFLDPSSVREQERIVAGETMRMPYFEVPGIGSPPLWGATAMILSGLVERIRAVLSGEES